MRLKEEKKDLEVQENNLIMAVTTNNTTNNITGHVEYPIYTSIATTNIPPNYSTIMPNYYPEISLKHPLTGKVIYPKKDLAKTIGKIKSFENFIKILYLTRVSQKFDDLFFKSLK